MYHSLTEKAFKRDLTDIGAIRDAFECVWLLSDEDREAAREYNKRIRNIAGAEAVKQDSSAMLDLYKRALLLDAPFDFDAYCMYIEWDREPKKRFYLPRRKQLLRPATAMQRLADGELNLLGISMPPGVGKTTLALFYICWLAGREPDKPILTGSHNSAFLRGAYDECLRIIRPGGEYSYNDVFPDVSVEKTNAQDLMINLGTPKRFGTLEFSSVGSGNAGKVRAEQLLYCDDLVEGIEAALSRERMDKLWQMYSTDLRQRKIGNCRELHIATRWSVHDVIGRLEQRYGENADSEFIVMPALDENDESNFNYPIEATFTTKFYHEQREAIDDASWRSVYMNEPYEREGQLYNPDELRRYFDLPDCEPDAILSVCDTKDRGTDYCVMPIAYKYGDNYYIEEILCDNGMPEVIDERLVQMLCKHRVDGSRFESNSAGGKIAEKVQKGVKEKGCKTRITTKFSMANKETRIILAAGYVKEHFLFKDESKYTKEYKKAMNLLTTYTMAGKNKNDDVPDAMSMLVDYIDSFGIQTVTVAKRPF